MQNLPPYVSWSSFLRALDSFPGLIPEQLDSTSLPGLSVSLASQMMQALRFLGLVRADGAPSSELRLLTEHPELRSAVLLEVFRRSYPELFGQRPGLLSEKALEELIERTGLSPATQRKAVTFVLNAASYMNLTVEMNTPKGPRVPEQSASGAGVPASAKKSRTLELASGGTVEISLDVDLLLLDKADREFVFDLIDKVQAYREHCQREKRRETEPDHDQVIAFRGDEEVRF